MKTLKIAGVVLTLALAPLAQAAETKATAEQAMAAAQAAWNETAQLGYWWLTTEKVMQEAKKQMDAGKFDEAKALADEAVLLSNATMAQAKRESENWQARMPR